MEVSASVPGVGGSEPRAESPEAPSRRQFRYAYTPNWPAILSQIGASLLISSYHAGELVAVGVWPQALDVSFHHFQRVMGIAVQRNRIAVGTQTAIWFLAGDPDLASRIEPVGRYDACFLAHSARFTGEIQSHELAWSGAELWVVNTRFSCLCTLDDRHNFAPGWRPSFISSLAPEDRCHLNGLAMTGNRPRFVTSLAETDSPQGWRANKTTRGCLIDLESGETVIRGLAMPHSPRIHDGKVWLLDSGRGRLVVADLARGSVETVAELPGFTRGLALLGPWAFVGLSKIRAKNSDLDGVPIAERPDGLKSGVAIVDYASGREVAFLEFHSGIEEVFDVQLVPGVRSPLISGPNPHIDSRAIWVLP